MYIPCSLYPVPDNNICTSRVHYILFLTVIYVHPAYITVRNRIYIYYCQEQDIHILLSGTGYNEHGIYIYYCQEQDIMNTGYTYITVRNRI
jgi:hypothetical protein